MSKYMIKLIFIIILVNMENVFLRNVMKAVKDALVQEILIIIIAYHAKIIFNLILISQEIV